MQATQLHTEEASNKVAAFLDARVRSYAASTHYTDAERLVAERMRIALELVYSAKQVYVTFRKKFITVKVEAAVVRDRRMLALLESDYAARSVSKAITPQGVIYRIPKVQ